MAKTGSAPPAPKPRCLFLNTLYPGFLAAHYAANPGLAAEPYAVQKASLYASFFGDADFYSRGLRAAGWAADDIILNCDPLQAAWAREHGTGTGIVASLAQVRDFRPDVIYLQDLNFAEQGLLSALRPLCTLIVGQIASPVPAQAQLHGLDILFTSFPHFADDFRKQGLAAYYQPLAFDERVWEAVSGEARMHAATFVGGISPSHREGTEFLEKLASLVPMDFWGYGRESLAPGSRIAATHHGEAWGRKMFSLLAASRITVNRHIDTARQNANNMRLFEATGCGALLITDYKDNLHDLFEIGKEVVAYRSAEECAALIEYYALHREEAEAIAKAGQVRTLRDHTYLKRMASTGEILARHLRYRREKNAFAQVDYAHINYGKAQIGKGEITQRLTDAWKDGSIPARQRALTQDELAKMYAGGQVTPYQALADCLKQLTRPGMGILEIGCSTGYYCEVLEYLLKQPLGYVGVDYSPPMIDMALEFYPGRDFRVADGANLPFADGSMPIVVSSCVLLHVPDYAKHIRETARVAGSYVVVHRTPVCRRRPTHYLKKFGYGVEMVELMFNEEELLGLFRAEGLELIATLDLGREEGDDAYTMNYIFAKALPAVLPAEHLPSGDVRHYCTLFDRNYLTRGVALARSLIAREKSPYVLHAVCLDELSRAVLASLSIPNVMPAGLHQVEEGDSALLGSRADRSLVEYYFTLTPSIIKWVQEKRAGGGQVTYLDSDLYFFSSPDAAFGEMEGHSVLIHGHRFSPGLAHLATDNGIYNVGLLSFRGDARARGVLAWWRARCIEWCKAIPENGKMGDQKYLDDWPTRFPGVRVLEHVGAGLAPWNLEQYRLEAGPPVPRVDGLPVVFFHFHALGMPSRDVVVPAKHPHYPLTPESLALLYVPYARALRAAIAEVTAVAPFFSFGFNDAGGLQGGAVILARPEVRITGTEAMPKASLPDGWECYVTPQLRPQGPRPDRSAFANGKTHAHVAVSGTKPVETGSAAAGSAATAPVSGPDWSAAVSDAEALFSAGRTGEAKAALIELCRRKTGDSRVLNDLAVVSHSEGALQEALGYLVEALKTDPRDRLALINLADLGMTGKLFEPIQNLILGYLDSVPDDWEVRAPLIAAETAELDRLIADSEDVKTGWSKRDYEITALVSTYKSEAFIEECLIDLQGQTVADKLEIVIVDANSPQNERAVVERFQKRYGNIRYLRTRERIGIYPAWNLAARMAGGRFLTPMSTNDRLAPDAYEVLLRALREHPEAGLSYGDTWLTTVPHQTFANFTPTQDYGGKFEWPPYSYEDLLMNCRVGPHPVWRSDLHAQIGWFDGRYKAIGDQDFWLRIALKAPLVHIPRMTGLAWITKDSLSGQGSSLQEIFDIQSKHTRAHLERLKAFSKVPALNS